jgi:hypothetical protein
LTQDQWDSLENAFRRAKGSSGETIFESKLTRALDGMGLVFLREPRVATSSGQVSKPDFGIFDAETLAGMDLEEAAKKVFELDDIKGSLADSKTDKGNFKGPQIVLIKDLASVGRSEDIVKLTMRSGNLDRKVFREEIEKTFERAAKRTGIPKQVFNRALKEVQRNLRGDEPLWLIYEMTARVVAQGIRDADAAADEQTRNGQTRGESGR